MGCVPYRSERWQCARLLVRHGSPCSRLSADDAHKRIRHGTLSGADRPLARWESNAGGVELGGAGGSSVWSEAAEEDDGALPLEAESVRTPPQASMSNRPSSSFGGRFLPWRGNAASDCCPALGARQPGMAWAEDSSTPGQQVVAHAAPAGSSSSSSSSAAGSSSTAPGSRRSGSRRSSREIPARRVAPLPSLAGGSLPSLVAMGAMNALAMQPPPRPRPPTLQPSSPQAVLADPPTDPPTDPPACQSQPEEPRAAERAAATAECAGTDWTTEELDLAWRRQLRTSSSTSNSRSAR